MANVQQKSVDRNKGSPNLSNRLANLQVEDDDYVDYHDIWNKEPPKALVNEHLQVTKAMTFFFVTMLLFLKGLRERDYLIFCSF